MRTRYKRLVDRESAITSQVLINMPLQMGEVTKTPIERLPGKGYHYPTGMCRA